MTADNLDEAQRSYLSFLFYNVYLHFATDGDGSWTKSSIEGDTRAIERQKQSLCRHGSQRWIQIRYGNPPRRGELVLRIPEPETFGKPRPMTVSSDPRYGLFWVDKDTAILETPDGRFRIHRGPPDQKGSDSTEKPGDPSGHTPEFLLEQTLVDPPSPLIKTESQKNAKNPSLVDALRKKIIVVTTNPGLKRLAPTELDHLFATVRNRALTPYEQDLFNYYVNGAGEDIPIEYRPEEVSGAGYFTSDEFGNDRGYPFVKFGKPGQISRGVPDPRDLFQLLKHEMSHTMDGLRLLSGQAPELMGYNGLNGNQRLADQAVAFKEFRANLWAFDGDAQKAFHATFMTYTAMQRMAALLPSDYQPDRIYRVLMLLSRDTDETIFENEEGRALSRNIGPLSMKLTIRREKPSRRREVSPQKCQTLQILNPPINLEHSEQRLTGFRKRRQSYRRCCGRWRCLLRTMFQPACREFTLIAKSGERHLKTSGTS